MAIDQDAYVTLVNSDNYLPGAAVLAHSLRDSGTSKKLVCMVTPESLSTETLSELKTLYDYVIPVDRIHNPNPANLYLLNRGDLLYAFTKINVWRLVQFRKVVFVDADVVALRAPDELFDIDSPFSAAPDIGWPDAFNTGVMALKPNMGTYWALQTLAASGDSFDGADQGLLNQYYAHKDWHRLSFTYNCTPNASYQYEPAYRFYKSKISMVHFIGKQKPWVTGRSGKGESLVYKELVNQWWAVYDAHYRDNSSVVQRHVRGEEHRAEYGYSSALPAEPTLTDSADTAEAIAQQINIGPPPVEQRRFSPPVNEWDATRAPPPAASKPEAQNFPTQTYSMSSDPHLFHAPKAYPEPPKDMWYQVPQTKPAPPAQRPKPIFPWEDRPSARPTRVFSDDIASPVTETAPPALASFPSSAAGTRAPAIKVTQAEVPVNAFGLQQNVWDGDAGIDSYMRRMSQVQRLKGKLQVLHGGPRMAQSPASEEAPNIDTERRESMVLTDFPSAIERPSLPVTPAPMRKAFWGEERDSAGNLPQAEGVPNQVDWDPSSKLEELRRHSLQMDPNSLIMPNKGVPRRDMPRSSIIEEENSEPRVRFQAEQPPHPSTRQPTAASSATPSFSAVDFGSAVGGPREDVLSPTEHGKSDLA